MAGVQKLRIWGAGKKRNKQFLRGIVKTIYGTINQESRNKLEIFWRERTVQTSDA